MSKKRGNQGRRRAGLVRQDYRGGGSVKGRYRKQEGGMAPEPGGPALPEYLTNEEDDQEGAPTSDPSSGQGSTPSPGDSNVPNTENTGNISDEAAAAIANPAVDPQEGSGPPDDESFVVGDPGGPASQGEVAGGSSSGTPAGTAAFAQNGQETGVEAGDTTTPQGSNVYGVDPVVVDAEKRKERIAATGEAVAEAGLAGDVATLAPDAVLPDAVQVGYQRDAEGNLVLDDDGNPIKLAETKTMKMESDYGATATEAAETTQDVTTEGEAERAATPLPGLDPSSLIDAWAASGVGDQPGTDMSSPKYNPETGKIEKFTEDGGVIEYTPEEFAAEFNLDTGAAARTSKMKVDLLADKEFKDIEAVVGELSEDDIAKVTEISTITGPAKAAEIAKAAVEEAKAENVEGVLSAKAFIPKVGPLIRVMSPSPQAEEKLRKELTEEAAQKEEAKIPLGLRYDAVQRAEVHGEDATMNAANMVAATADIPDEIARTLVQDPAEVEAMLDEMPVDVVPAIAALPPEALVSAQMQSLVGSMEDGEVPLWAKPAVAGVNAMMQKRGMAMSSVGRDALFNAIITQAFPMAQSNAQALQARAAQNLSHEQQANIEESRQDMTRRMANLANRQTAESQTAGMAQEMGVLQSKFDLETRMASEGQEQQVRMANLENEQQAAVIRSQNEQQANALNLDAESQMNLAQLRVDAEKAGADQSAENQSRMAEFQVAADFMAKNAAFTQDMRKANMSQDNQMRLANLASKNQAASELLTHQEHIELANLNSDLQVRLTNDKIASAMDLAQLSVDQERAVKNAATVANMDMTKFTMEQQVELANSKWMQTAEIANMNSRQQAGMQDATAQAALDIANVDQRTKLSIRNAQAFLGMNMSNLNREQQAGILDTQMLQQRMLSDQSATNAGRQFNAASENQMEQFMTNMAANMNQFNASQNNSMEQFNANQTNMRAAGEAGREADRQKFNAQLVTGVDQFNTQITFQRDNWNASNAQAVEQSNTQWRRQSNTINTAAQNKINSQNAMNSFNMNQRSMSFLWQELRDQADYDFKSRENERQRKAALAMAALGNEGASYEGNEGWNSRLEGALNVVGRAFGATSNNAFTDDSDDDTEPTV